MVERSHPTDAQLFKMRLAELGLTQRRFAQLMDYSEQGISKMMVNDNVPYWVWWALKGIEYDYLSESPTADTSRHDVP